MHAIIATYYHTPVVIVYIEKCIFTIGAAVTRGSNISSVNIATDYSRITARDGDSNGVMLARCLTGLGPSGNDNGVLGGLYYNGNRIPNSGEQGPCASDVIQVRPGSNNAGVINIHQCGAISTAVEGIYTCTMMNSSMMNQSVRFGVYFSGRSESLDLYTSHSYLTILHLYTAAPVIDTPSSSTVIVTIGSSLTLSCTSRGSPPDTFTWRKDNGPVLQSTTTPVTYNDNSAVFSADYSITSVTTSDSGTYTCNVTNPIGSDRATVTVVVTCEFCI